MTGTDGITILQVCQPQTSVLTKTLARSASGKWIIKKSYGKAYRVWAEEHPVAHIHDLAAVLDRTSTDPKKCAIRGGIIPGLEGEAIVGGILRRKYDRADKGEKATLEPRARRWVALDLDQVELPAHVDPLVDTEHVIEAALEQLPPEFQDASCWWQLTSGHGIKPGGRCRLWFWLSRATEDQELKNWLRGVKVDHSLFDPIQVTYTADPIFPAGVGDFLPRRHGTRLGSVDEVEVPAAEELAGFKGAQRGVGAGDDGFVAASVEDALDRIGDPPAYPDGRGFHEPIKAAFNAAFRKFGSRVNQSALLTRIDAALDERGHTRDQGYIRERKRDARRWIDWYVRRAAEAEAASTQGPAICDPPVVRRSMPASDIAKILDEAARTFFAGARTTSVARANTIRARIARSYTGLMAPTPPQGDKVLLASGVATAKTEIALRHAAAFLSAPVVTTSPPWRGAFIAPDHNLAADVAQRFRAMAPGMPCHVHLGANQPDPDHPDYIDDTVPIDDKATMCRRASLLPDARGAGGSIQTLCGSKKRGLCPHHPDSPNPATEGVCGRMRAVMPKTGLIIMAGPDALTEAPHGAVTRSITIKMTDSEGVVQRKKVAVDPFDFVIVDEPKPIAWLNMPRTIEPMKLSQPLNRFGDEEPKPGDEANAAEIGDGMRELGNMVAEMAPGRMIAEQVRDIAWNRNWADLSIKALSFMPDVERYVDARLDNDRIRATLKDLKDHTGRIFGIKRWAETIGQAVKPLEGKPKDALSGLIEIEPKKEKHETQMTLRGAKPLHEKWAGMPMLLLDATPSVQILRGWLPTLAVHANVQLTTPTAVTRRQVWNSAFSYASWVPDDPTPPESGRSLDKRETTVWNNIRWLQRFLTIRATAFRGQGQHGIDVLAIVPNNTEKALRALWDTAGGMPAGLAIEHWNAIRGVDKYRGVRGMALLSRPLPSAAAMETDAWTMTGVVGATVPDGQLPLAEAAYLMRDGTGRRAAVRRHPDPDAESVRWLVSDTEVEQGDGRPRPGRRDDGHPLLVEILTNTPLPVPIDEMVARDALRNEVTLAGWMLACGVCPVPSSRGFDRILAAADGVTEKSIEHRRMLDRDFAHAFDAFLVAPQWGWTEFNVQLSEQDRYTATVWINANTPVGAASILARVGVAPHSIEVRKASGACGGVDGVEAMIAAGVKLHNSADAHAFFPEIFTSRDQAKKLFQRIKSEGDKKALTAPKLHNNISYMAIRGSEPGFVPLTQQPAKITYKPAAPKHKPRTAIVWPHRLATFRQEMEAAIGPLDTFEIYVEVPVETMQQMQAETSADDEKIEIIVTKLKSAGLFASTNPTDLLNDLVQASYVVPRLDNRRLGHAAVLEAGGLIMRGLEPEVARAAIIGLAMGMACG